MAVLNVVATLEEESSSLSNSKDVYSGKLVAPKVSGECGVEIKAYDDSGNMSVSDSSSDKGLIVNVSLWHPPKTDWKPTDRFNIEDYNRIKNNLVYLHELAESMWKPFEVEDMGADIDSYEAYWNVDVFNMFESNLEVINNNIFTQDYGYSQMFFENGPFIKWDELNRIESAILSMDEILKRQKFGLRKLSFRLGKFKEVSA